MCDGGIRSYKKTFLELHLEVHKWINVVLSGILTHDKNRCSKYGKMLIIVKSKSECFL